MTTLRLTYNDLSSLMHAIVETPPSERPTGRTIRKVAAAYKREGGDLQEFADRDEFLAAALTGRGS